MRAFDESFDNMLSKSVEVFVLFEDEATLRTHDEAYAKLWHYLADGVVVVPCRSNGLCGPISWAIAGDRRQPPTETSTGRERRWLPDIRCQGIEEEGLHNV